jgi:hypothetical protein
MDGGSSADTQFVCLRPVEEETDMLASTLKRVLALVVAVCVTNFGFAQTAGAAVIGTQAIVQAQDRAAAISRIQAQLARADVRQALVDLGVDPAQAQARVSALTDAEVAQLDQELANLPAAGDGGWILLVILLTVLVVLFATGKLKLN